jgi:hypothetical protein
VTFLSDIYQSVADGVASQANGRKADEITINPSSQHGHQGNDDVFVLNDNDMKFELFRSSGDLTYICGANDTACYFGGGKQTIYDFGQGTHLQVSEITAPIKVFGFDRDPTATVAVYNAADPTLRPDGHGGTLLGNIDFVGATLSASQVSFPHTDIPLSSGVFV